MHCFVLLCIDVFLIACSTLAAAILCASGVVMPVAIVAAYCALTIAAAIPILLASGLNRTLWRFTSVRDGVHAATVAILIAIIPLGLSTSLGEPAMVPRSFPFVQALLLIYVLCGVRVAMRLRHDWRSASLPAKARPAYERENILLVGLTPLSDLFLCYASKRGDNRMNVVGILSNASRHHGRYLRSRKVFGSPEAVRDVLHDLSVHGIFVDRIVVGALPNELTAEAQGALSELQNEGIISVNYLSHHFGLYDGDTSRGDAVEHSSSVRHAKSRTSYLPWKRAIDATTASAGIACFSPLMIIVCLLVLVDVGWPAIFWQQRPGAGGRPIKVLKFRTMGAPRDGHGRPRSDVERVSRTGRILRRLRLDELPQLFNVLLGHMSLVGPRPLLPVDQPSAPAARLRLRPGLTGWAQINGGRHLSNEDKAALDIWYIQNASLALDLKILLRTVRMVLLGERVDNGAIQDAWQFVRSNSGEGPGLDGAEHNAG